MFPMRNPTILAAVICGAMVLSACSSSGGGYASSGATATNNAVAQGGEAVAAGDPDPRVCKTVTPIGTRIGQRTCMKQSEWDRMAENARKATRETQQRANQVGNPSGT